MRTGNQSRLGYCAALAAALVPGAAWPAAIAPGELLITEVMANPVAVSDSSGEWFEVFNASGSAIDLAGLTIADDGASRHALPDGAGLAIAPGEFFVLGRSDDLARNGGAAVDYVYDGFALANGSDAIRLLSEEREVAILRYGPGFVPAGASMELALLDPAASSYRPATEPFGLGDFGTPGLAGQFPGVAPVPLPAAAWLLGSALGLLLARRPRRWTAARR